MPAFPITLPSSLVIFPPVTRYLTLALIFGTGLAGYLNYTFRPGFADVGDTLGGSIAGQTPGGISLVDDKTGRNSVAQVAAASIRLANGQGQLGPMYWLVMCPYRLMPWTVITAAFVETNIFLLVLSLCMLPMAGRYLEKVWGSIEYLKFVLVVTGLSYTIALVIVYIESFLASTFVSPILSKQILFTNYNGMLALSAGFLVAFTQLIPEHSIQIANRFRIRVKNLPMAWVTVSNIMCFIGYQSPWILIQFGWLVSWFYLRFYKYNETIGERGDRSDAFAFAQWFPPFLQKPIGRASNLVFHIAVKLGIVKQWTYTGLGLHDSDLSFGIPNGLPGGTRAEAERRRALALKALDQRVATRPTNTSHNSTPSGGTPDLAHTNAGSPGTSATIDPTVIQSNASAKVTKPKATRIASSHKASVNDEETAPSPTSSSRNAGIASVKEESL